MFFKNFFFQEAKAFLGPPRQNYKILFLNVIGLQIFRYFLAYIKYEIFKNKRLYFKYLPGNPGKPRSPGDPTEPSKPTKPLSPRKPLKPHSPLGPLDPRTVTLPGSPLSPL